MIADYCGYKKSLKKYCWYNRLGALWNLQFWFLLTLHILVSWLTASHMLWGWQTYYPTLETMASYFLGMGRKITQMKLQTSFATSRRTSHNTSPKEIFLRTLTIHIASYVVLTTYMRWWCTPWGSKLHHQILNFEAKKSSARISQRHHNYFKVKHPPPSSIVYASNQWELEIKNIDIDGVWVETGLP